MTAATGARCIGGVCLYTDRNVIASDGAVSQGCKIYYRNLAGGSIALASATDDAISARDLANQILDNVATAGCSTIREVVENVRETLITWSAPYPSEISAQFLMAVGIARGAYLYTIQPRNIVTSMGHVHTIGAGARVIEQLLPSLFPNDLMYEPRTVLFMLAYLTKQAKIQEVYVGNQTGSNAILVRSTGRAIPIRSTELHLAEELVFSPDAVIGDLRRFLLALESEESIARYVNQLRELISSTALRLSKDIQFQSLLDAEIEGVA